jgi:HD superfamily phosphodiesterase
LFLIAQRQLAGHGTDHAEKVALEAGALAYIEGGRLSLEESLKREACLLAQIAGLLHDLRRHEKDHAKASASAASRMFQEFFLFPKKGEFIVQAIARHPLTVFGKGGLAELWD